AGNGRDRRSCAGRDERLLETEGIAAHGHRIWPGEPRLAEKQIHAERPHSVDRDFARDPGANVAYPFHRRTKIDLDVVWPFRAVLTSIAHVRVETRRSNQRLRWDATRVQAVAAETIAFDQRHSCASPAGFIGRQQTSRPGADDDETVPRAGNRHVRSQPP